MQLKKRKTKEYDQLRQAMLESRKYRVIYLHRDDGRERQSAWFRREANAEEAYARMVSKHGKKNVVLYID